MDKIIWQPTSVYQEGYDFGVLLDREFAEMMLGSKISLGRQRRMNGLGLETLKRFRLNTAEPYSFHEDTCLVTQFTCDGSKGAWLSMNMSSKYDLFNQQKKGKIRYSPSNVDHCIEAYGLMALVDMWVEYSEAIKEE